MTFTTENGEIAKVVQAQRKDYSTTTVTSQDKILIITFVLILVKPPLFVVETTPDAI